MKKKNYHPGAQTGSIALLKETLAVFLQKGLPADRALNDTFRRHKMKDERVRAELARRFYGIIRYWRPLVTALGNDSVETIAEVKVLVETLNLWKRIYKNELPDASGQVMERLKKYARVRKMRESFPDWLDELAVKELGEKKWEAIAHALNSDAPLFLRVNTLKTDAAKLAEQLNEEGIEAVPVSGHDQVLRVKEYRNVFSSAALRSGLFEVQDLSSQAVAAFLDVHPGMRVADACAGNGGKTLHLAALMHNKGKIIAMDVSPAKLDVLRARCAKAGVDLVETKPAGDAKTIKRYEGTFDRLLLDVPCSGTGVLRRNPDIRWRLHPGDIERMMQQQQEILKRYAPLVKPGGKLVYATCSILPCEGEEQVKLFLGSSDGEWEAEDEMRIDPVQGGGDGFYMMRMKRRPAKEKEQTSGTE